MKQKKNTIMTKPRQLLTAGIIMLLLAPFIQSIFVAIASSGCPVYDGQHRCGFDPGLGIAFYAELLPLVWIITTAIILVAGIILHLKFKKKS